MVCKNLNHLIFIIFQFFLLDIYGQFIPGPRIGQTAVLIRDKIYYIGGYTFGELNVNTPSDFFYLGGPTKTWVDLKSQGAEFPLTVSHTANVGCSNQDSIFIIGGVQLNESNLVYQFDTKTNKISVPIIKGKAPPRRGSMSSVSYEGKVYVFSGRTLDDNDNNIFFDNLDILDTINLSWGVGSLVNAPLPRFWYTATLVNEIIYYISGRQQDNASGQIYTPMSNIYQYDIIRDTWSTKIATATGNMPGPRGGHSAVLVGDKIYVFGGRYRNEVPATETIAILDTTTLVWSIPPLKNPNVPKLVYHSAILLDKLMLVAFGNFTDVPGGAINNDFYIFDLGSLKIDWVNLTAEELGDTKNPNVPKIESPISPNADNTSPSTVTHTTIIGLSIGLVTVVTIIGFTLIYNRMKKNKDTALREIGYQGCPDAFDDIGILQIPPSGKNYPIYPTRQQYFPINQQYLQQFVPPYHSYRSSYYSPIPTFSQSQRYSLGQEFSTLPPTQEGTFAFSPNSSNYPSGREIRYSSGSEINYVPERETHYTSERKAPGSETYYAPGRETPPPPPKDSS